MLCVSTSGLWGERELSRINRELKLMGPQADGDWEQQFT